MTDEDETFEGETKSSKAILTAIRKAEDTFREWQTTCQVIDEIYSLEGDTLRSFVDGYDWRDSELDLFWSSFEVMKPAIYARPPQPVVSPLFKDGKPVNTTTAELLERCAISVFKRTGINDIMTHTRDDLLFAGRGALWVRHEVEDEGHEICVEHKDRLDFLHEPARKWCEVGWVAAASWMTKREMRKRFSKTSGDAYQGASFTKRHDREDYEAESRANTPKAKVWEVWHKAEGKVHWVTEGVDVYLDSGEPHLKLNGFFPCPRPAYATLRRRSLIPVPDWERYSVHFSKISELTRRIYSLLDKVRMKGLIPAGGDVGDAVEQLIRSDVDDSMLVPVPQAAMMQDATGFVQWLPLNELAQAIQGIIESRATLIQNFYELSGISDIMRGATDADETLGAQQLKSQYGSVRVREKSTELQRVAADAVAIAAEIIAEKFPQQQMLDMSQMDIPTKASIEKRIKEVEKAAEAEIKAMADKVRENAAQMDPQQAQQAVQQAQQQILAKYGPMLQEAQNQVPIEDVVALLRDDRARNFIFEIESSSTILTDELQEKQSRNEFLSQFSAASQSLMGLASMGESGAKLAGAMMKFVLAPYRAGRDLDGAIEEFIDQAPQMAAAAAQGQGDSQELIAAQNKLAEAEQMKAQAAMEKVQADSAAKEAESQRKIMEMQVKAAESQRKADMELEKLRQQAENNAVAAEKAQAEIDKLRADTIKALADAGVAINNQALDEFKSLKEIEFRATDQRMGAEQQQIDNERADRADAELESMDDDAGEMDDTEEGAPAKPSAADTLMEGLNQLGMLVANSATMQTQALQQLAAVVSAPTQIVRDNSGRPVGARKVMNNG